MLAEPVGKTGDGDGGAAEDYILIRDEKASGTNGGTFIAGSWVTRDLTTKVTDTGNHASLASNQITLAAGTYKVRAHAPAFQVIFHKIKLYNVSDAADIVIGTSEYTSVAVQARSFIEGRFTIADTKVIELQHRCSAQVNNIGLGRASGFGVIETYAVIEFRKEA